MWADGLTESVKQNGSQASIRVISLSYSPLLFLSFFWHLLLFIQSVTLYSKIPFPSIHSTCKQIRCSTIRGQKGERKHRKEGRQTKRKKERERIHKQRQ